jgi:hypothetical protein
MSQLPPSLPAGADDFFLHQIVAPHGTVGTDQRWGERSFFSVPLGDEGLLELGLRAYPQTRVVESYAVARCGTTQYNVRAADALEYADALTLAAGTVRTSIVRPLSTWHLSVDAPESGIEAELTFEARTSAFYCRPLRVERDGDVLVDNITFFQSGRYSGSAKIGDHEFELSGVSGARDRSWGHRKRESAPARGLMTWMVFECQSGALIAWIYEKADGTRTYTDGAWLDESGEVRPIQVANHRYEFDRKSGGLVRGTASIDDREIEFEVRSTIYMAGAGHTDGRERSGQLKVGDTTSERWEFDSAESMLRRRAVDDNYVSCVVDGKPAHGIVEVARGAHVQYGDPPPHPDHG